MLKILFVNACVRGAESRTLELARIFLEELCSCLPDTQVIEHDLMGMNLRPVDRETLMRKEALCDERRWDNPLIQPAADFQRADAVIVAAPYWDMSFPSILKVWVENMYVRNLTFRYVNDQSVGLCSGREAVYITTAGSPIGEHDWGTAYIRDVLQVLGIPGFAEVKAETLDLAGSDPAAIMHEAGIRAKEQARALAQRLR